LTIGDSTTARPDRGQTPFIMALLVLTAEHTTYMYQQEHSSHQLMGRELSSSIGASGKQDVQAELSPFLNTLKNGNLLNNFVCKAV
jgi:hypothetical protein